MRAAPVSTGSDVVAVSATAALSSHAMAAGEFYQFVCTVDSYIAQDDLAYLETYAELDCGDEAAGALDTVIRAADRGADGNSITIELVGDSPGAGGVTIDESGDEVTIHFEDGVSTVGDVETAIAGAALIAVKTAGTGATVLAAATDEFGPTALAGGGEDDLAAVDTPVATAADGSMFVPANTPVMLEGTPGDTLSVIRASGDGTAVLTRMKVLG